MNRDPLLDQLTREQLAELAGDEHARLASHSGARVHTPKGLARAKARELLRGSTLDDLLELDTARRRAGHDPIPQSVLVASALGDRHSLVHYRLPEEIPADVA